MGTIRQRVRLLITLFAFTAAVSLVVVTFYLRNSDAVIWRYKDPAAVDPGQDLYVVFNPLRDRSGERAAERLLAELSDGRCEPLKYGIEINCEREAEDPLKSWELLDRSEKNGLTIFHFAAYRQGYELYSNLWIAVDKEGRIADFGAWY